MIAAAVVLTYFAILVGLGGHSAWGRLGVPPMSPSFADLRSVTSAWECTRLGIDVMVLNPCDLWKRPANYPRVWTLPSALGIGEGSTVPLGFLVAAVFFLAALAVVPRRAGAVDGLVYGAALCSPAVMLGVERGNVDLVLFAIVVLAVLRMRHGPRGPYIASGLLLFAAILKLFPIFAVSVLARQRRRVAILSSSVVLGAFAVYAVATLGDIRTIARVVPQSNWYSYGATVVGEWLARGLLRLPGQVRRLVVLPAQVWGFAAVIGAVTPAVVFRRQLRGWLPQVECDVEATRDLDLFWAGASVYACTYALFRSFDYRLVFLVMTIPQLLRWARRRPVMPLTTLLSIFGTLWLAGASKIAAPAQFVAFAGLVAALAATVPTWNSRDETPEPRPAVSASRSTHRRNDPPDTDSEAGAREGYGHRKD